jgi:hypothetical protein
VLLKPYPCVKLKGAGGHIIVMTLLKLTTHCSRMALTAETSLYALQGLVHVSLS